MEELLQEAFNYRHEAEDGRKYKALVIKKEDFERQCSEVRDESLSHAVIAAIDPVVGMPSKDKRTQHYQVKLLEALLVEVQSKCGEQE